MNEQNKMMLEIKRVQEIQNSVSAEIQKRKENAQRRKDAYSEDHVERSAIENEIDKKMDVRDGGKEEYEEEIERTNPTTTSRDRCRRFRPTPKQAKETSLRFLYGQECLR